MLTTICSVFAFVFGFACAWWLQQYEVDRAEYECRCRNLELKELRKEIGSTTRSTAFMRRWAKLGGGPR